MHHGKIIYSLSCPITENVHYIGKSTKGMLRPMQHLTKSHSEKIREWVDDLKLLGYKPAINILERVLEGDNLDNREKYWVQYYLNEGAALLNVHLINPITISPITDYLLSDGSDFNYSHIGEYVKRRRKIVGITQDEFASKMGIALTVIRKIEQGKYNLNFQALLNVLSAFNSTLEVKRIKKKYAANTAE